MPRKGIVTTDPLYWMPLNVQEILVKIAGGLTTEQFGAAMLLILTSWTQQPPCTLPTDDAVLAKLSGLGTRWQRHAGRILGACQFVDRVDGRLRAHWLSTIYAEQRERYEHRSQAGKANRAKREQVELPFPVVARTNGRTKSGTNGRTNPIQNEKGEVVAPKGANNLDPTERAPDALAPQGARAGLRTMRPITDILRLAEVPRE